MVFPQDRFADIARLARRQQVPPTGRRTGDDGSVPQRLQPLAGRENGGRVPCDFAVATLLAVITPLQVAGETGRRRNDGAACQQGIRKTYLFQFIIS